MKKGIHPDYKMCKAICACGNTFETRSTTGDIHVEICSNCHPFFTGKQKLIDTAGRVEKYMRKYKLKDKQAEKTEKIETKNKSEIIEKPDIKEEPKNIEKVEIKEEPKNVEKSENKEKDDKAS